MENNTSLMTLIQQLPQLEKSHSFGRDIDEIHKDIFREQDTTKIEEIIRKWASSRQPCVFGKLASKKLKGLDYHLTIINKEELLADDAALFTFLKDERLAFKKRALTGEVSAHLIYFVHPLLAYACPGPAFMEVQKKLCSLHMPECYPIMEDVIYTESVPFRDNEGVKIYKAGVNVFYSAAHGTRNHDRRIPGGFLISVNAPGHFLRLALNSGVYPNEAQALDDIKNMTIQSVGHGGISHPEKLSTTWHAETKTDRYGCPVQHGHASYYSGFYHTDVLIPGALTCDNRQVTVIEASDKLIFNWNVLFYVSLEHLSSEDPYYGEFIGIPVCDEAAFFNPFSPRRFEDGPLYQMKETA